MTIWFGALVLQAGFWMLFVTARQAHPVISFTLVNTLSVLAMVEYVRAIREFLGRPHYRGFLYGLVLAVAAINLWYGVISDHYSARVISVSIPGAILMLWLAYTLTRHAEPGISRPVRITAVFFLITAMALVLRLVDTLTNPGRPVTDSTPQQFALMVYAFFPIFCSVGFLLMQAMRAATRLETLANVDDLTGTLNRRSFRTAASRTLAGCRRSGRDACLLLLDLDHFKQINDCYGHEAGDRVLREFCRVMRAQLRAEDLIARLGGEEFAVLLPGASLEQAVIPAERIRRCTENLKLQHEGHEVSVTVSIGISRWDGHTEEIEPLLREADRLMYRAKESGRNLIIPDREAADQTPTLNAEHAPEKQSQAH